MMRQKDKSVRGSSGTEDTVARMKERALASRFLQPNPTVLNPSEMNGGTPETWVDNKACGETDLPAICRSSSL